jgi:two-component system chemotaxis response regulator CheB
VKVLVVENSEGTRQMVGGVLRAAACDPLETAHGTIAIHLLKSESIDVVMIDWAMLAADGGKWVREMRASLRPCPPVVVFSYAADHAAPASARRAGADDYLALPMGADELVARLRACVERYRRAEALQTRPQEQGHPLGARAARGARKQRDRSTARFGTPLQRSEQSSGGPPALLVGVAGGSSGAVVLQHLLGRIDAATRQRCAFVVVLHESPAALERFAGELGARHGLMARVVTEPMVLEAGAVYLAGADRHLVANPDGALGLLDEPAHNDRRPSADWLFRSLARRYGRRAIALVLSGPGSDGARGAELVANARGTVLLQLPGDAEVPAMPAAAQSVARGAIAVPTAQLATTLASCIHQLWREHAPARP